MHFLIVALILAFAGCSDDPKKQSVLEVESITWQLIAPGSDGMVVEYTSSTTKASSMVTVASNQVSMEIVLDKNDFFDLELDVSVADVHPLNTTQTTHLMPLYIEGCAITWEDVIEKDDGTRRIKVNGNRKGEVDVVNCSASNLMDYAFTYLGDTNRYTPREVQCVSSKARYVSVFVGNYATIESMPIDQSLVCDYTVETTNGTIIEVVDDGTGAVIAGNTLAVTVKTSTLSFEVWDVSRVDVGPFNGFTGFLFKTDVFGALSHVLVNPNVPRVDPVDRIPVELCVRSARPYTSLTASCDFNGVVTTRQMTQVDANNSHFCEDFSPLLVQTDSEYACNFYDANGDKVFAGTPLDYFLVFANGVPIQNPSLDNYELFIDPYGNIVVDRVDLTLTCYPDIEYKYPVFGYIGVFGEYLAKEMTNLNGTWSVTFEDVPLSVYEANISHGGAFKSLIRTSNQTADLASSCQLEVNGVSIVNAITYTHAANWIFRLMLNGVSQVPDADLIDVILTWGPYQEP